MWILCNLCVLWLARIDFLNRRLSVKSADERDWELEQSNAWVENVLRGCALGGPGHDEA